MSAVTPPTQNLTDILFEYRLPLFIIVMALVWVIAIYYFYGRKPKTGDSFGNLSFNSSSNEASNEVHQANEQKLQRQVENLTKVIAKNKSKQALEDIRDMAEQRITNFIPEKMPMLDPDNSLIGRPIYYAGSIPIFNKRQEISTMLRDSKMAKILPGLAEKLVCWRYFGPYDTLFFYATTYMPDGRWAIVASTKPAKLSDKYFKLPSNVKTYILYNAKQESLDRLILNRWEVTKAKAAIQLAATFLGPLPMKTVTEHLKNNADGWENL
jgi:hypothetical protein